MGAFAYGYKNCFGLLLAVSLAGCAADHGEAPAEIAAQWGGDATSPNSPNFPSAATPGDKPLTLFDAQQDDGLDRISKEPLVQRGTGRVVGEAQIPAGAGVSQNTSGDVTLNVVDAEIRDVVQLVLEDALGANYTIDPAVTGSITVRTSKPIPAKDVLAMLGSVLSMNGAALIDTGGLYKVVPIDQAAVAGGRPVGRLAGRVRGARSGVQVAPLRYADAAQIAGLLQPFAAGGGIQVDTARNTLLLVGSPDQVATMNDLIDMFDVDWMSGLSFGLYPLKSVAATQLAEELDQILGDPAIGVLAGGVRLVPIDRLSALIVITSDAGSLDRIEPWIDRLDKKGEGTGEQVYVYSVQNGRAGDLAQVLGELFDIQSTSVGYDSLLAPGLEPVALGSSLSGYGGEGQDGEADPSGDNGGGLSAGNGNSYGRSNGGYDARSLNQGHKESGTRIVADEASNALLVRATAEEYKKIQAALQELDKQPLQVLLEATIAEVTLKDELSYGVQWFLGSDESSVTLSEFDDGSVSQLFPGFSGLLSRGDVRVVLNALDSVSDVNVVSSPQILVLDNQTAQLEVGDEVPIVTRQAEGTDTDDSRVVNTVEQRQTGVILNVTPRVNSNGLVVLDIQQEVSDVVRTTTSGIDSPTIAQRRIGTSVAVSSDQTIVLGGLIQDDVEEIDSGVPLLKDIPVLGSLFGATTQITNRTELLVMITPKVLRDQNEAVAATDELRRRLWSLEPLHAKVRNSVITPPAPGAYTAELAFASSEVEAWNIWMGLGQRHALDLGAFKPKMVRASNQTGQRSFGLQVGPFKVKDQARALCLAVHDKGEDCRVVETN